MTQAGYEIDRDEHGLTMREKVTIGLRAMEIDQVQTAKLLGVSKQRVGQLVRAIDDKGVTITRRGRRVTVTLPPKGG